MDTIDRLPKSKDFDAILVVVDRLTKMAHFIPTTSDVTSKGIASLFYHHIFSKHGTPTDIVSDRGTKFTSDFFGALGTLLNIKLNFSTAYHPQTDGQTERVNQILEQYLRAYVNYDQDDWAELLLIAEFAYNNAPHSTTNLSPFFANFGYHPNFSASTENINNLAVLREGTRLQDLSDYLKSQIEIAQADHKKYSDRNRLPAPELKIGDEVWLSAQNIRTTRPTKKLDSRQLGPFKIAELIGSHAVRLELPRRF